MSFPTDPLHSPGWFDNCFEGSELPADIRAMSEALCKRFTIRGLCDPMYIANVAAFELGRGTGTGTFHPADSDARDEFDARLARTVDRLCFAYSTCIGSDREAVRTLLVQHLVPRA